MQSYFESYASLALAAVTTARYILHLTECKAHGVAMRGRGARQHGVVGVLCVVKVGTLKMCQIAGKIQELVAQQLEAAQAAMKSGVKKMQRMHLSLIHI